MKKSLIAFFLLYALLLLSPLAGFNGPKSANAVPLLGHLGADTLVLMADGTGKRIAEIKPGDKVLSSFSNGKKNRAVAVTTIHKGHFNQTLKLDDSLVVSPILRIFYLRSNSKFSWRWAENMTPEKKILLLDEARKEVKPHRYGTTPTQGEPTLLYALELEKRHNMFVKLGDDWMLVGSRRVFGTVEKTFKGVFGVIGMIGAAALEVLCHVPL